MKIIPFVLLLFMLGACSSKYGISKAKAYVQETVGGTVKVDHEGRPGSSGVSKRHLIYVETDSTRGMPEWETVWVEKKPYGVRPVEVMNGQVIGKDADGSDIRLTVKNGHKLWQLVLLPKTPDTVADPQLQDKIETTLIVITGTWKDKSFAYRIKEEHPMQPLHFQ